MLQNAILVLQMITSPVRECGGVICYQQGHAVEQTLERLVIGSIMTLMWRHCNNANFGITDDYVSSERMRMFPLLKQGHTIEQQ